MKAGSSLCREGNVKINRYKNYLKVKNCPEHREVPTHDLPLHDNFARTASLCQEQYCETLNLNVAFLGSPLHSLLSLCSGGLLGDQILI